MAGHSKWANIKHRKQSVDNKRSKLFHKLNKDLQQAIKQGSDPKNNLFLKNVISKIKAANMPKDMILKALNKEKNTPNKENYFWTVCLFAKQIFFIFKMEGVSKNSFPQDFKKFLQKNKTEILPLNAIKIYFQETFKVSMFKILENVFEEIVANFSIMDFTFDIDQQKMILFFKTSENLKEFQDYALKQNINIEKVEKTYLPITKIKITPSLKEEFLLLCKKIKEQNESLLIIDNLEK